jgi:hypothetical protein
MPAEPEIPPGVGAAEPSLPVDLVEATIQTRLLVLYSFLLWTTGFVLRELRDRSASRDNPSLEAQLMVLNIFLHLFLLVLLVGIVVSATRAGRALGLGVASKIGLGAWVPCCNPFVNLLLLARLFQEYSAKGLSPRMFLARRGTLEEAPHSMPRRPR